MGNSVKIKYSVMGRSYKKSRSERCCESSMTMEYTAIRAHKESRMEMFRAGMGTKSRKHGQRGGVGLSVLCGIYPSVESESHRSWRRGERVHYRTENRKGLESTLREENACNTVKASRCGVIYRSNPCAIKFQGGRV